MAATIHRTALATVEDLAHGVASLLGAADPSAVPPGLQWSVREVAAHLVSATTLYTELASGASSPLDAITPEALQAFNAERIADVADTELEHLAKSIVEVARWFVEVAGERPAEATVHWHAGIVLDTAQLSCVLLAEYLLHGLDLASASGAPWVIDPQHVALVLHGYGPVLPACVDPIASAGHTAIYELDLGAAGQLAVRFADGVVTVGPGVDASHDCRITADPSAFLLVSTGRMPQSTAIALGLMSAPGRVPNSVDVRLAFPLPVTTSTSEFSPGNAAGLGGPGRRPLRRREDGGHREVVRSRQSAWGAAGTSRSGSPAHSGPSVARWHPERVTSPGRAGHDHQDGHTVPSGGRRGHSSHSDLRRPPSTFR